MLNLDSLQQLKQLKSDLKASKPLLKGVVKGTSGRFGFVQDQEQKNHFLNPDEMSKVLPGDEIEFTLVTQNDGKEQAEIEKLINSSWKKLIGKLVVKGKAQFLETDMPNLNRMIYIPPGEQSDAESGDYIECELTRHPYPTGKPQAKVIRLISKKDAKDFRHQLAVARFERSSQWPDAVLTEANALTEERIQTLAAQRESLTQMPFVTIDSASTQDMDDALYVETKDAGWTLWVAVADPAALIEADSALDQEAKARAISLYFPGMNIPMLPDTLTQNLCSLRPNEDRLAWVVRFEIGKDGSIGQSEFKRATIRSSAKLSYTEVANVLDRQSAQDESEQHLHALNQCALALRDWRSKQALIMDERPDYYIQLNDQLDVVDIELSHRNSAHRLVEECMLAVNRTVAGWFEQRNQLAIFNTHPGFRKDRWQDLRKLLEESLPTEVVASFHLSDDLPELPAYVKIIQTVDQANLDWPLKAILTRNLDRGALQNTAAPHFGMGFDAYATFTSPIRKYSDLTLHRLMGSLLEAGEDTLQIDQSLVDHLQMGMGLARQVSQWIEQWYRCEYMQHQPKQTEFAAEVVQVNSAGIVVRLKDTGVEGFVDFKRLDESFKFDPLRLIQKGASQQFTLGDPINVQLKRIDWSKRSLEFKWVATA